MAIFGSLGTVRLQAPPTPAFAAAFAYLDELRQPNSAARQRLEAFQPGASERFELNEGAFAIEQVYHTKPRAEGFFESHQKYVDIQVIVEGEERMEIVDASRIRVREPYQAARDLVLYEDICSASTLHLVAGEAAIFFPVDVHMPSLRCGLTAGLVRKTVVKVPAG
jgi:YhcH/YjgK/YiaL family protein